MYERVERFVVESFTAAGREKSIPHYLRTAYWLKELRPDADDALLVAAVAHDIERAFQEDDLWKIPKESEKEFLDEKYLQEHQERSARILREFLKRQDCGKEFVQRVKRLVSRHEIGGSDDENVLKDADSISFFENNAERFAARTPVYSVRKIREKLNWMYERITSERAREMARPMYEHGVRNLSKGSGQFG